MRRLALSVLALSVMIVSLVGGSATAAGDAHFSFSPDYGSFKSGSTIKITISETSRASDNTNGVETNLSLPPELTVANVAVVGPFTLCAQKTYSAHTVTVACAASTAQSGTKSFIAISAVVNSTGSGTMKLTSGSGIDSTAGKSVWNGSLTSASYSFTSSSTAASNASGSSATTAGSTSSAGSKTSAGAPQSSTANTELGSLSVTVSARQGQHLGHAAVTLDGQTTSYTNTSGVVNFSGIPSGSHTLKIIDGGYQSYSTTVTINPGQNKIVAYRLNPASSHVDWYFLVAIVVVLLVAIAVWYWWMGRHAGAQLQ